MKKTLLALGTIAVLLITAFRTEFVEAQVPENVRVFGKLPTADTQVEIFAVSHPYEAIGEDSKQFPCTVANGEYEAMLPPGWYRFRVKFNDSTVSRSVLYVRDKEINRDLINLLTRPEKPIEAATVNPFDSSTFPEQFAERVAQLEKDIPVNKGIVIVGRIVDAQGKPLSHRDYHALARWGNIRFEDEASFGEGWFISNNFISSFDRRLIEAGERHPDYGKTIKLSIYSATNEPAVVEVPLVLGTIYYADIVLDKTPENELVSLSGTVLDEENKPMDGVSVNLRVTSAGALLV